MLGELFIVDILESTCSCILETYMGEFDIPEAMFPAGDPNSHATCGVRKQCSLRNVRTSEEPSGWTWLLNLHCNWFANQRERERGGAGEAGTTNLIAVFKSILCSYSIALCIIIKWYNFNIPYVTYSSQEPRDRNRCVRGPFSKSVFEITVRQPLSEEGLESRSSDGFISCQTLFFCLFRNSFHTFFLCVCAWPCAHMKRNAN